MNLSFVKRQKMRFLCVLATIIYSIGCICGVGAYSGAGDEFRSDTIGVANNERTTFYIKNISFGGYLTCNGQGNVSLSDFTGSDNQKWQFYKMADGSYWIISLKKNYQTIGNQSYVLYAYSGSNFSSATGTSSNTDLRQKWIVSGSRDYSTIRSSMFGTVYLASNGTAPCASTSLNGIGWKLIECSNEYGTCGYSNDFSKVNETDLSNSMNCYAFVSSLYHDFGRKLQPGEIYSYFKEPHESALPSYTSIFTGEYSLLYYDNNLIDVFLLYSLTEEEKNIAVSRIVGSVDADFNKFYNTSSCNYILESDEDEIVVGNWRKVALVLDYKSDGPTDIVSGDYHWYYCNDDNEWHHKPGFGDATSIDSLGNTITNPELCNRTYDTGFTTLLGDSVTYTYEFINYYKVRVDSTIKYAFRDEDNPFLYDDAGDILQRGNTAGIVANQQALILKGKIEYSVDSDSSVVFTSPYFDGSIPCDVDFFEFMVDTTGYYNILTASFSIVDGALYRDDTFICYSNTNPYISNFGFEMRQQLIAGQLYRLCVFGKYKDTITNYQITIYPD